jgi:hypothetical protein
MHTAIAECRTFNHGDFHQYIKNQRPEILPYYEQLYVLKTVGPVEGWRRCLSPSQYQSLVKHGTFVLAYAYVVRVHDTLALVEWFETRVPGKGFATYLRRKLRRTFGDVLPRKIPEGTCGYWRKELGFDHEDVDPREHMHLICGEDVRFMQWDAILI